MSKLRVLNQSGDTTLEWDVKDPISVEAVEKEFNQIIKEGYMAFKVDSPTEGELIRNFDPTAEEIIMTAPMVGG
jgi:hypothetical protein